MVKRESNERLITTPLNSSSQRPSTWQRPRIETARAREKVVARAIQVSELRSCVNESRGGRPAAPVLNKPTVSVDVKQHSTNYSGVSRCGLAVRR